MRISKVCSEKTPNWQSLIKGEKSFAVLPHRRSQMMRLACRQSIWKGVLRSVPVKCQNNSQANQEKKEWKIDENKMRWEWNHLKCRAWLWLLSVTFLLLHTYPIAESKGEKLPNWEWYGGEDLHYLRNCPFIPSPPISRSRHLSIGGKKSKEKWIRFMAH